MIPVLHALPIDWSGESPDNRTKGEVHDLSPQFDLPYRIVVMEKGYFYTDNMYIIDNRGRVLKEDVDYQCLLMEQTVAKKRGLSACAIIAITNPDVGNFLYIEAQMVGGIYCTLNKAILEQAANVIRSANRAVYWKNISGKPSGYRPNGHLHALWELFGFTPQTAIIHRMTTAIDRMSQREFDNLYNEFDIRLDVIKKDLVDVEARLTTHINDRSDPHDVTALQVHLEMVYNTTPATVDQARTASGTVMNAYATPLRAVQSIATNFTPRFQAHLDDYNNPHQDTAAKLGTLTNIEMNLLANQYYNRGDTVTYSVGLGGMPWTNFYQQVRSNIPISNITTGYLPWPTFAGEAMPGPAYVLAPSVYGILGWRSIASIFTLYGKKGNMIFYAGTIGFGSPAGILGGGYPVGTICVYRQNVEYGTWAGNGEYVSFLSSMAMATYNGSQWSVPGIW